MAVYHGINGRVGATFLPYRERGTDELMAVPLEPPKSINPPYTGATIRHGQRIQKEPEVA